MRRVSSVSGVARGPLEAPRRPPGVRGPQVENPCSKNLKSQVWVLKVFFKFLLCNLINKSRIQISIVICEIHQCRRHFSHGVLLLRSLEICL